MRDGVNDDAARVLSWRPALERDEGDVMLHVDVAREGRVSRCGVNEGTAPEPAAALDDFPRAGSVLERKYRLVDRLAAGSMGCVWRAEHLALEVLVAIKFMQPSAEDDADTRRRFLREARIGSALNGRHVAQVLDFGMENGRPYMVMELLQGESLARRLRRAGPLSPQQTADILVPLAQALQRVHDLGVVHRDIKPDNVFIVQVCGREHPKLLDFGVAKAHRQQFDVSVSRDTAEGERVGTPHYMSPEQARGATSVDHLSDVWALGVMAFECLLGYPPFFASGLGDLLLLICTRPLPVPSAFGVVPVGFDAWFARACARAPEARFSSVLEAAHQLRVLCANGRLEGPQPPLRSGGWGALWRWLVRAARRIAGAKGDRGQRRWLLAGVRRCSADAAH